MVLTLDARTSLLSMALANEAGTERMRAWTSRSPTTNGFCNNAA